MKKTVRSNGSYAPVDQLHGLGNSGNRHDKVARTYNKRNKATSTGSNRSSSAFSQGVRTSSSSSIPQQFISSSQSVHSAPWAKTSTSSKPDGHGLLDRLSKGRQSSDESEGDNDVCSVKSREVSPQYEIMDMNMLTSSFDAQESEIIPSSQVTLLDDKQIQEEPIIIEDHAPQGPPVCSLCKKELQENILNLFFENDYDKWTRKYSDPKDKHSFESRLCRAHRRQSSLDLGISRDYPRDFDRQDLIERVSKLISIIRKVILGKVHSRFTKKAYKFAASLQGRPSRLFILQQSTPMFKLGAGYYGPQGASLITQIIFDEAGKDLERAAHFNDWIAKLTTERYIYIVLVPHVTSLLIMQDYKKNKNQDIDEKKAAKILEQSYAYGCAAFPNIEEEDDEGDIMRRDYDEDDDHISQDEEHNYNELLSSEI